MPAFSVRALRTFLALEIYGQRVLILDRLTRCHSVWFAFSLEMAELTTVMQFYPLVSPTLQRLDKHGLLKATSLGSTM